MKDKLLTAFEKRTLRYHTAILNKARDSIKAHHSTSEAMQLPSFKVQLAQLANFPVALMEGVLRMRLSYELTLRQQPPSLMIIDSFILDLRSALALACYIKDEYVDFTNPDEDHGWALPNTHEIRNDSSFDLILREALILFFNLLDRKLKVSAFFKETEILQPEWSFLSTAANSIKGGDIIVANRITRVVTQVRIHSLHPVLFWTLSDLLNMVECSYLPESSSISDRSWTCLFFAPKPNDESGKLQVCVPKTCPLLQLPLRWKKVQRGRCMLGLCADQQRSVV